MRGAEGRDALWAHPDLMPTAEDFDDPEGFVAGRPALDMSALDEELSALDKDLGQAGPDEGGPGDGPGGAGPEDGPEHPGPGDTPPAR